MYQVEGQYLDYSKMTRKSYFFLNADQAFNFNTWSAPVQWKGRVGGQQVSFKQISDSGSSRSCYDWTTFPVELEDAIPHIVEAIDKAMRVMD